LVQVQYIKFRIEEVGFRGLTISHPVYLVKLFMCQFYKHNKIMWSII